MKKICISAIVILLSFNGGVVWGVSVDSERVVNRGDSRGELPFEARAKSVLVEENRGVGVGGKKFADFHWESHHGQARRRGTRGLQSALPTQISPISDKKTAQALIKSDARRFKCAECDVVTRNMIAPQLAVGDPRCARCFTRYQPVVEGERQEGREDKPAYEK